ncbi:MAG: hypothetical protein DHS20C15_01010 [Planctomycetota bacterium]|nr:MAG: hypothetical protein DHS20C15_01010 [Planctomycetota bacterium]
MPPEEFQTLAGPGGLEIQLLPTRAFKTVILALVVEAPLDEQRSARALVPDLLSRGTASFPDLASLGARCEELFDTELLATCSAAGGRQLLKLGVETVADRWVGDVPLVAQAAELLAELVHAPPLVDGRFVPEHVEQERVNLVRALRGLDDDKGSYAVRSLLATMHADTPWAHHAWGTLEAAQQLDEVSVRDAWTGLRTAFPARLFIAGDVSEAQVADVAERLAAGATREAPSAPEPVPQRTSSEVQRQREDQDLAQSKLAMGWRLPSELLPGAAAGMFAEIFGGSASSRLFKRVREQESLAYGCGSVALPDSGTLLVQAGLEPGTAERVEQLVGEERERLARDGVRDAELELARTALRRRLLASQDRPGERLHFRLRGLLTGRATTIDAALEQLAAVTASDVTELARGCALDSVFLLEGRAS